MTHNFATNQNQDRSVSSHLTDQKVDRFITQLNNSESEQIRTLSLKYVVHISQKMDVSVIGQANVAFVQSQNITFC